MYSYGDFGIIFDHQRHQRLFDPMLHTLLETENYFQLIKIIKLDRNFQIFIWSFTANRFSLLFNRWIQRKIAIIKSDTDPMMIDQNIISPTETIVKLPTRISRLQIK